MHTCKRILIGLAAVVVAAVALAQSIGTRTLASGSGSTDNVAVASTNTYYVLCDEYEAFTLLAGFKGTDTGNSTVRLDGYRQLGASLYETSPCFSHFLTLNGTTTTNTVMEIPVEGATVMKLVVANTNATVAVTNLQLMVRYKAPKLATFPTSR